MLKNALIPRHIDSNAVQCFFVMCQDNKGDIKLESNISQTLYLD